ncbi:MAG: virulence protein RhuM/Fic/DOC family protein [Candidatus Pacebacteria bacterium]|nr:virulence protein RhuM/Fic/DOC family protein [Candidatus Paceibacterota bacterium]MBP9866997.1 virulence protein RhuM/Fic/DOC family protein [Candidatus Paceibacterota bacterium]
MKKKNTTKTNSVKAPIKNNLVIYQAKSGAIELKGDVGRETVWATQAEIVSIFGVDQSVVSRHIKNLFKDGEIEEKSNMQKMHNAISDKPVTLYSLDVILGVGYRTNSKVAIEFRKWATKTLRNYIVDGFVVDKKRIVKNYAHFLSIVDDVKKLLPESSAVNQKDAVELISLFADTWLSLDAYDKELLPEGKLTKKKVTLSVDKVSKNLNELRNALIERGETTEVFGNERSKGSISGIVGNVMQSFGGVDMYPTVEEKAAHILYFMVKNHPFTDGNKRSGAFAFIWFLKETKLLDSNKLTPQALTAITVLVAESDPNDKEKIIKLILNIISK